jgi:peptidoglycan hydrolase-like protein with peptidoglycan-binding domain
MFCKARTWAVVVGLMALAVLLCGPSASFAATEPADLIRPGAGYATPEGSEAVRDVQRLLRRFGDAPGPIDGLYGPLTTGAVQRFQEAQALAIDGVVGPQTMGRLMAERRKLRKAKLERKSPARGTRAESVTEQPPAHSPVNRQPAQTTPQPSNAGSPWLAPVVGGLALVLLLAVLWALARRRRNRPGVQPTPGPRLGLVCAGLLAAYAIGAATGAVFATYAAPDDGAKPKTAVAEPRTP